MKPLWILVLASVLAAPGCKKKEPAAATPTNGVVSGNPLLAPVDYLGAQAQGKRFAQKTVDLVQINSAIQKFQAMEDRFPRDFNELVQQHYLQSVPVAPPGMRFAYNPETGEVKVVRAAVEPR